MKLTIARIAAIFAVAAVAMFGAFTAVDAQTGYSPSDPAPRGSTFEPDPATANSGALGFQSLNPQPSASAGTGDGTVGGTGGGLAITGSETDLPLAIGIALLALGGTAVVASRKRDED